MLFLHFSEVLERVVAHQLPDEREEELLLLIHEINASNTNERELELFTKDHRIVLVCHLLEFVGRFLLHLLPVYNSRLHSIDNLEQIHTIRAVVVEVVDVEVLQAKGVHPHAEGALFAGVADVVLEQPDLVHLLLIERIQTRALVEDGRGEGQVQLRVAFAYVRGRDEGLDVQLLRVVEHHLSALFLVCDGEAFGVALARRNLV
mmetsp:Transcript_11198/g.15535  ORF Transcript_11198/g.15535 Transcript_11198/m.15535 type:complete len:204 (-) Transcript_11198:958-1569(-)